MPGMIALNHVDTAEACTQLTHAAGVREVLRRFHEGAHPVRCSHGLSYAISGTLHSGIVLSVYVVVFSRESDTFLSHSGSRRLNPL